MTTKELKLHSACLGKRKSEVTDLLNDGADPKSIFARDKLTDLTPLHYACMYGWVDIVEQLVEKYKCDANAVTSTTQIRNLLPFRSNLTPLHFTCLCGHTEIAKLLIEKYHCNPNVKDSLLMTPLHYACLRADYELAKFLIINMDVCDLLDVKPDVMFGNTLALHCAWGYEQSVVICELITHGANPNVCDNNGNTLLHKASQRGNLLVVKHLLNAKCNPNIKNCFGMTPLQLTSTKNSDVIQELVSHGANPNVTDGDGNTPLHKACERQADTSVKSLLNSAECDPNTKNKCGFTPLQVTSIWKSDIIHALIMHGAVTKFNGTTLLHRACMTGFEITIKHSLKAVDCDLNAKNRYGLTPLQVTSPRDTDTIQILTAYGAIINVTDNKGNTPLHKACRAGCLKTVKVLLYASNSNVNAKNRYGCTPLQMTPIKNFDIIHELIEHGANTNVFGSSGSTLLHDACQENVIETVKYFLTAALYDPDSKNDSGLTPLLVTSPNRCDIIKELITHGASPYVTDSDGNTLLHKACQTNALETVNYILNSTDCDLNALNKSGLTPLTAYLIFLQEVKRQWNTNIIQELITHGADTKCLTDSDGNTLLHIACLTNQDSIVRCLLNTTDCIVDSENKDGLTPLQVTVNATIIRELIRHGASTNEIYKTHGRILKGPLQPPVKVFVVGNPSVGKSTLTAALKIESSFFKRAFTTSQKITGVDTKTAGVVPHDFESREYGYVTFYDFAGQREFYGSHAALLQNAVQLSPPIFIIVVDLCESEEQITQTLLYWMNFLENQCTSVSSKPHVTVVGSHADVLKERGEDPEVKFKGLNLGETFAKHFILTGFIAMDCQYSVSNGIDELRMHLKRSCEALRTAETISFNAHCFYVYLVDKFKGAIAVTVEQVQAQIKADLKVESSLEVINFLPDTIHRILSICDKLNDRGHILFLKDLKAIDQSWAVIDKTALLAQVSGSIFAPDDFKQHKVVTQCTCSTGVVPLSSIATNFPDHNPEMLIKFLSCLEFCQEIFDPEILHCITAEHQKCAVSGTEHSLLERFFLFPALVSLNVPANVWEEKPEYTHYCGWILRCSTERPEQFFTSRFLQVLMLRLAAAYSFPLPNEDKFQYHPAIQRNCSIWKKGIFWANEFGIETLVEVLFDNKAVIVLMRCISTSLVGFAKLRSQIIYKVLHLAKEICSRLETVESFIDPSDSKQYPLKPLTQLKLFSISNTSTAILNGLSVVSPTRAIRLQELLQFEPYDGLGEDIIYKIFENHNQFEIENQFSEKQCENQFENYSTEKISDSFLSRIAEVKAAQNNPSLFIKIFNPQCELNCVAIHNILHELKKWKEGCAGTYKSLREKLDAFSILAGRNLLFQQACLARKQQQSQQAEQSGRKTWNSRPSNGQNEEDTSNKSINDKPTLKQLLLLEGGGKTVRIIESVAAQWRHFALELGIRTTVVDYLRTDFSHDSLGAATEVLTRWLNGESDLDKPITWDTLIHCLNEAGKLILVGDLAEILQECKME